MRILDEMNHLLVTFLLFATYDSLISCDEILFEADSASSSRDPIDKSAANLVLIDQIYRENLKQTQLILECNQKLATLESELNMVNLAEGKFTQPLPVFPSSISHEWNDSSSMENFIQSLKVQLIDYFK